MKARNTSVKTPAKSKIAAKSAAKKSAQAKNGARAKSALTSKLKGVIKNSIVRAKPAAATTTAAKKVAPITSEKKASALAGTVKVQEKGKSQKNAVADSPVKASAKPAAAAKPVRPPARPVPRDTGAQLSEDDIREMSEDEYMNEQQLKFFRTRLILMREEVLQREMDVKERLHEREVFADPADRATAEEEHWLDLRLRERESLLLKKIDEALRRIEGKEYGYCEKTGDPIGIPRLLARPTATVCVDVKGQDERVEAQFRDR